jgi:hypothetical protein
MAPVLVADFATTNPQPPSNADAKSKRLPNPQVVVVLRGISATTLIKNHLTAGKGKLADVEKNKVGRCLEG